MSTSNRSIEERLAAPLVPLKHVHTASNNKPGYIPRRPSSLPYTAPFGQEWHSKHGQWTCETLVFPAAYPRSIARSSTTSTTPQQQKKQQSRTASNGSNGPPPRKSKEEINKAVQDLVSNQRDARLHTPDVARCNGPNPLWIAVNRFTPQRASKGKQSQSLSNNKDPVTLVFAHANGFSKETWEATIADTIANWDTEVSGEIEDIFVLDMVNQGDSAILNQDTLGTTFEWSDNGRDILQFILSYLPEASSSTSQRARHSSPSSAPSHGPGKPFFWSKSDPSLSHWAEERGSVDKEEEESQSNSAPRCERGVGGYITEDPSLSGSPSRSHPPPAGTFRPRVLPYQQLPPGLEDVLALDKSRHSARRRGQEGSVVPDNNSTLGRWRGRRIILIGHSVGAAGMIYASSTFPQLFETLLAVDPTIFPKEYGREEFTIALTTGAVVRRDKWASRDEARALFEKNKGFFGRWEKRVLDGYVYFGLRDARDGEGVTLTVDKMQEAYVFADTDNIGSKRAFHRLALLPPTLNVHIIRADVGNSTVPEEAYPQFEAIVKHATHTRIPEAGHLIAQEKPHELALEITGYLKTLEKGTLGLKAKL